MVRQEELVFRVGLGQQGLPVQKEAPMEEMEEMVVTAATAATEITAVMGAKLQFMCFKTSPGLCQ